MSSDVAAEVYLRSKSIRLISKCCMLLCFGETKLYWQWRCVHPVQNWLGWSQWRRQYMGHWGTCPIDFQQFHFSSLWTNSESQLSKYCVVCEINWCRCQQLSSFDQYCIVYDVVDKKTSTRRRSRIPCVVVEEIRRVDAKTAKSSSENSKKSTNT